MRNRILWAAMLGWLASFSQSQCSERLMTSAELVAAHERVAWPDSEPWLGAVGWIAATCGVVWLISKTKERV